MIGYPVLVEPAQKVRVLAHYPLDTVECQLWSIVAYVKFLCPLKAWVGLVQIVHLRVDPQLSGLHMV